MACSTASDDDESNGADEGEGATIRSPNTPECSFHVFGSVSWKVPYKPIDGGVADGPIGGMAIKLQIGDKRYEQATAVDLAESRRRNPDWPLGPGSFFFDVKDVPPGKATLTVFLTNPTEQLSAEAALFPSERACPDPMEVPAVNLYLTRRNVDDGPKGTHVESKLELGYASDGK